MGDIHFIYVAILKLIKYILNLTNGVVNIATSINLSINNNKEKQIICFHRFFALVIIFSHFECKTYSIDYKHPLCIRRLITSLMSVQPQPGLIHIGIF